MTIEGHSVVFWLRRLLAPLISAGAGLAISYFGLPPDVVASSPGPPVRQLGQFSRLSGHVRQSIDAAGSARGPTASSWSRGSQRGRTQRDGGVHGRLRVTESTRSAITDWIAGCGASELVRDPSAKHRPTLVNHGHRW